MNELKNLEDCVNWIYKGYSNFFWKMRKHNGVFQYTYCYGNGKLQEDKWHNWPKPSLVELNRSIYKRAMNEKKENLSPICYKIRQLEERFKETHA